ncbi:MAG: DeoR/GlpR family DNA-binding transcription regulator [Oscillospiraceae bacterium]|nr:DeoR/GlpR family DNA-binding transcription regulator [Oscillospiraceae bacterium]
MIAKERREAIIRALREQRTAEVKALSVAFGVTEETIRRDLEKIEAMDLGIRRVYGGAYLEKGFDKEVPIQLRENIIVPEKMRIASHCLELIHRGDSVMLDASTTAQYIAESIRNSGLEVTVITNSLSIAGTLADCERVRLVCVGGTLRSSTHSFVGYLATRSLEQFHADKAFVSCSALHLDFGMTDYSEEEAEIRRLMLRNADLRYLVADHTKFGKCGVNHIGNFDLLHGVIVDQPLPPEWTRFLKSLEIPLIGC